MTRTSLVLAAVAITAPVLDVDTARADDATFELDERVPRPSHLAIETTWLSVRIEAISGDEVTVRATITADERDAERVVIDTDGDQVTVHQERDRRAARHGRKSEGQLVIGVPSGVELSVDTASGDVVLAGALEAGPIGISSASGDIRLDSRVRATQLRLSTASGDAEILGWADDITYSSASGTLILSLEQPISRLQADSASGDISVRGAVGEAKVRSASGDVSIEQVLSIADVSTISGQVALGFPTFGAASRVTIATVSGDQLLTLPEAATPSGSIETMSGDIQSVLPVRLAGSSSGVLRVDGSAGAFDLQSVSGDIQIAASR